MKLFRYRRPSLNTLLGITKAKKQMKKELGITDAMKPFRWWTNTKRRFKRKIGYESEAGRLIRNGLPRPGGCLVMVVVLATLVAATVAVLAGDAIDVLRRKSGAVMDGSGYERAGQLWQRSGATSRLNGPAAGLPQMPAMQSTPLTTWTRNIRSGQGGQAG